MLQQLLITSQGKVHVIFDLNASISRCCCYFRIYGFYDECKRRYNIKLWKTFTDCFNCLPIGMLVIACCSIFIISIVSFVLLLCHVCRLICLSVCMSHRFYSVHFVFVSVCVCVCVCVHVCFGECVYARAGQFLLLTLAI